MLRIGTVLVAFVVALLTTKAVLAAQPPAAASTSTSPAPSTPSVEQRVGVLEERLNTALAVKDEKIEDIKDRIENLYKLAGFVVAGATVILVIVSVRDTLFRIKEGQRQRGIDDIVKGMMNSQSATVEQQARLGAMQLQSAMDNPKEFGPVQNISGVLSAVKQTLDFRLEQEKNVAGAIERMTKLEARDERKKIQRFDTTIGIFKQFSGKNRMDLGALTPEQYKRARRLVGLVSEMDEILAEKGYDVVGHLLYVCGAITYYDNEVIESRDYLDRAAQCRAPDHELS